MIEGLRVRLQIQFGERAGVFAEGAAGDAVGFFDPFFERVVGGVARGRVFFGGAGGDVAGGFAAAEGGEVGVERVEARFGVVPRGHFGGPGILLGVGVTGVGQGDKFLEVLRDVTGEAEADAIGLRGKGGAGDLAEGGVVFAGLGARGVEEGL